MVPFIDKDTCDLIEIKIILERIILFLIEQENKKIFIIKIISKNKYYIIKELYDFNISLSIKDGIKTLFNTLFTKLCYIDHLLSKKKKI